MWVKTENDLHINLNQITALDIDPVNEDGYQYYHLVAISDDLNNRDYQVDRDSQYIFTTAGADPSMSDEDKQRWNATARADIVTVLDSIMNQIRRGCLVYDPSDLIHSLDLNEMEIEETE